MSHNPDWQGVPITLLTGKALAHKKTEIRITRINADDLVLSDTAAVDTAYEQVFLHAMQSKRALFIGSDEVLESWRILEPVQQAWEMSADDLVYYEQGHNPQIHTL
jgi:glucose-6-phosphate 1-dehydrogenase